MNNLVFIISQIEFLIGFEWELGIDIFISEIATYKYF